MKKYVMSLLVSLLVVATLTACGAGREAAPEKVRIALILPSTIDDLAWSQSMYEGVKAVQAKMGEDRVEVTVTENLWNPVDATAAIRDYAEQGYNLIIAHGAQYQNSLFEINGEKFHFPNFINDYQITILGRPSKSRHPYPV